VEAFGKRGNSILKITNEELLEAYYAALDLSLDYEFILLLEEEIDKRNLTYEINRYMGKMNRNG
jgi:hypothetical protein